MKKAGLFAFAALTMVSFMLSGCGKNQANGEISTEVEEKPIVAVTIVPEQTFVEAVCGDLAKVVTMVPPGSSPESYEPTPKEMEQFSNAELYFTIGVPSEEAYILPKANEIDSLKTVSLQDDVAKVYPDRELAPGERDPHIWLSPKRVIVMVESIAREMGEVDPANKETYEENAQAYIKELSTLDSDIQNVLKTVENKKFVVFHPAFGYLADDYGLEMYALEEEGKESTPQQMQKMIDLAKKDNIKVIFYQAEISSKQAEAFAEELGGKTVQLEPLAPNYTENLEKMAKLMAEVMQ
ncbi:High-affinity zinc uptake system binding-protein ZnuA [anaerobic digester metagenome]